MSTRKGREKPNVAGERYDTNARQIVPPTARGSGSRTRPLPNDLMSAMGAMGGMGGGGGMPDMGQMMEMMQKMGMGGGGLPGMGGMPGMGGLPGMGGMPGMGMPGMGGMPGMPGMMPPGAMMPMVPKILYHGLPEGAPVDKFFTFYPNYINSKKTVQQGRRVTKEAACEDPIAEEMSEVCAHLRLPHALELGKKYARDWMVAGRVRVRLIKEDGSFENPEIQTRKQLMVKMGEMIPTLQSRKLRLEKEAADAAAAAAASSSTPAGAGPTATAGSNKKKGKKKGKR